MNFDSFSSQFSFSNVATRKFGRSTFERSLIFKFEILTLTRELQASTSEFYKIVNYSKIVHYYINT